MKITQNPKINRTPKSVVFGAELFSQESSNYETLPFNQAIETLKENDQLNDKQPLMIHWNDDGMGTFVHLQRNQNGFSLVDPINVPIVVVDLTI